MGGARQELLGGRCGLQLEPSLRALAGLQSLRSTSGPCWTSRKIFGTVGRKIHVPESHWAAPGLSYKVDGKPQVCTVSLPTSATAIPPSCGIKYELLKGQAAPRSVHILGMELTGGEKALLCVPFKPIFYAAFCLCLLEVLSHALAGVAQWIQCWPGNQSVASPLPVRAHAWACRRHPHTDAPLPLSPFPSLDNK